MSAIESAHECMRQAAVWRELEICIPGLEEDTI